MFFIDRSLQKLKIMIFPESETRLFACNVKKIVLNLLNILNHSNYINGVATLGAFGLI